MMATQTILSLRTCPSTAPSTPSTPSSTRSPNLRQKAISSTTRISPQCPIAAFPLGLLNPATLLLAAPLTPHPIPHPLSSGMQEPFSQSPPPYSPPGQDGYNLPFPLDWAQNLPSISSPDLLYMSTSDHSSNSASASSSSSSSSTNYINSYLHIRRRRPRNQSLAKRPIAVVEPHDSHHRLVPLLFEFSRLLAIVPAVFGTLWNLYQLFSPPRIIDDPGGGGGWGRRVPPDGMDFFVAALWSLLTGYQCLALTTGLLRRWQAYYTPLPTLIRLLALQGICWPATQLTLSVLDVARRPVVCWCVIGTTTCASRSVQIWVTSNIVLESEVGEEKMSDDNNDSTTVNGAVHTTTTSTAHPQPTQQLRPRPGRRLMYTSRRWDWKEVGVKCVLPAGVVYFVMAWLGELRKEWTGC